MSKDNTDSSELEMSDQNEPLLPSTTRNTAAPGSARMVSVRFASLTEERGCTPCSDDVIYLHQHQIVLPETTTVEEFLTVASRMVGAKEDYTYCHVDGKFRLRRGDPIGPTVRSYEYIKSPVIALGGPAKDSCCCCLLI